MEYTKDIILNVNYGHDVRKTSKRKVISSILNILSKHKIITGIVFLTIIMGVLDFILITSFINTLSNI